MCKITHVVHAPKTYRRIDDGFGNMSFQRDIKVHCADGEIRSMTLTSNKLWRIANVKKGRVHDTDLSPEYTYFGEYSNLRMNTKPRKVARLKRMA